LSFAVTGGQVHDSQVVEGTLPIIPNRRTAIMKAYCPKRFYRSRHKIKNIFCRIKVWRRISTRPDAVDEAKATEVVG